MENSGPENGLSDSSIVKEGGHVQVHCVEMPLNYVNPDFCIVECFDLPQTKETLIKALNAAKSLAEGLDNVRYAVSMHVHAYVTCSHSPACFVPLCASLKLRHSKPLSTVTKQPLEFPP